MEDIEIIKKVSELYMKYGIKSVTMDDLARELGISKKTLYQYFKDKDDVVSKVVRQGMENQMGDLCELCKPNSNAIDELLIMSKYLTNKIQKANMSFTYDLQKYYPEVWKWVFESRKEHILKHVKENMKAGIKQGFYRKDLNFDIISAFYIFRLDVQWFELVSSLDFKFEEIFNALFIYHIRGIANNKGIEYLEKKIKEEKLH